jgi:hypothetical protein
VSLSGVEHTGDKIAGATATVVTCNVEHS